MCRLLGVSRSAYYQWRSQPISAHQRADAKLLEQIRTVHQSNRSLYGSPRVHAALRQQGVRVGRKRVARLMHEHRLRAKTHRRFTVTTRPASVVATCADLVLRQFRVEQPNRLWSSDITYIWTMEGWTYLAVVLDLFSRRVVGWELGSRLTDDLVISALSRALEHRDVNDGLVFHSDRGRQYTSEDFRQLLERHGLRQSWAFSCYDNAVSESFMHTIKTEHLQFQRFETREAVRASIFNYIEVFYNRQRLHSTLNMLSPAQFELLHP